MKDFKVLIVDDESDFLETTSKRMRKHAIRCECAQSGEEAIRKVRIGDIDVVLLDVKMPGMGGVETLREIKRLKPLTEVVMLTGHASVESGIEGMKLGAFDYLMKPMEFDKLVEKLHDAYEKKALQEEKIEKAQFTQNLVFHRGAK